MVCGWLEALYDPVPLPPVHPLCLWGLPGVPPPLLPQPSPHLPGGHRQLEAPPALGPCLLWLVFLELLIMLVMLAEFF